jgi:hypothetical protein
VHAAATACRKRWGALDLALRPEDLARLEAIVPPDAAAGARYNAGQMAHLDSELG